MPKPFKFPDPNDRSFNDPRVIVSSEDVLRLYNKSNDSEQQRVTKPVRDWFVNTAKDYGWSDATFTGSQCTLEVNGMKDFHKDKDDM